METKNEIWKPIEGYEDRYEVSNLGRVRRLAYTYKKNNRWGVFDYQMKPGIQNGWIGKDGYHRITLSDGNGRRNFLLHRLVAKAFVSGYQEGYDANHIDENKDNNRADNLEWITHKENINHGNHNARATAHNVGKRRSIVQLSLDGQELQRFESLLSASKALGIDVGSIGNACKGKTKSAGGYRWRYAED